MDRSTLEKLILAKLPLPADFCQGIKDFFPLNPPTPSAVAISQLKFQEQGRDLPIMRITGSTIRATWMDYPRLCWSHAYRSFLTFSYNAVTGEPIRLHTMTPPWIWRVHLQWESQGVWDHEVLDEEVLEEEVLHMGISRSM